MQFILEAHTTNKENNVHKFTWLQNIQLQHFKGAENKVCTAVTSLVQTPQSLVIISVLTCFHEEMKHILFCLFSISLSFSLILFTHVFIAISESNSRQQNSVLNTFHPFVSRLFQIITPSKVLKNSNNKTFKTKLNSIKELHFVIFYQTYYVFE